MPPEILALIDEPVSLIAVLFAGALIGMAIEQIVAKQRRAAWRRRNAGKKRQGKRAPSGANPWTAQAGAPAARSLDAADQLRTVMQADFTAQPLLNNGEARLFKVLDQLVIALAPPGWQVMAQVSLGEILRCQDKAAYGCINSKRVDLLIVDEQCRPVTAIEYQGGGHYLGAHATAARDAVKKEALRRAGIGYEEIVGGQHTPAELRRVVEKVVGRAL